MHHTIVGRSNFVPFLAITGFTYMAADVLKALAYHISHTDGMLRIGVFAGCGTVLLLGGFLMKLSSSNNEETKGFAAVIEE
ncbi:MAG: hypothetical protein FJ303_07295 [Planctomycetes bacterium]|nr:hypothetical protein [Planctomycetota bacterium]